MSKILAVFGATGQQGSSVVKYVLDDPELSVVYRIRAITRDPSSTSAQALKSKDIEVVQGDAEDAASLKAALNGVHTVFAMTAPSLNPSKTAPKDEYDQAKTIADTAVEAGAQYLIFSTLPSVTEISGGKYKRVVPFDNKAKAERYIRGLPIKSAFVSLGSFMENYSAQFFLAPQPAGDGTYILPRHISGKTEFPLVAAVEDTGKFVGAILAKPEKFEGKTFCAATKIYTLDEIVGLLSKSAGKTIVLKQISAEEFERGLPFFGEVFTDGYAFGEEFGYYGPETKKLVEWAAANARGKLTTFEEFLEKHPFKLE
jgi:uncharacterized protein YbjT (DUF2867 family)